MGPIQHQNSLGLGPGCRAEVQALDEAPSSAPAMYSAQIVSCLQEGGVYKFGHILEQQSHKWTCLLEAGRYLTFEVGGGEPQPWPRCLLTSRGKENWRKKLVHWEAANEASQHEGPHGPGSNKCPFCLCPCLAAFASQGLHGHQTQQMMRTFGKVAKMQVPRPQLLGEGLSKNHTLPGWVPGNCIF